MRYAVPELDPGSRFGSQASSGSGVDSQSGSRYAVPEPVRGSGRRWRLAVYSLTCERNGPPIFEMVKFFTSLWTPRRTSVCVTNTHGASSCAILPASV